MKIINFPFLTHDHVDLNIHLDPEDGLERTLIQKYRILLEKLTTNMFIVLRIVNKNIINISTSLS